MVRYFNMCMKHAFRVFSMCIHGMFIQLLMWLMWTMLYELWVLSCRQCQHQQISLFLWVKWQRWYSVSNKNMYLMHFFLPPPPPLSSLSHPLPHTCTCPHSLYSLAVLIFLLQITPLILTVMCLVLWHLVMSWLECPSLYQDSPETSHPLSLSLLVMMWPVGPQHQGQ